MRYIECQGDILRVLLPAHFKAGRLKNFAKEWRKITTDNSILDTVEHCHIEFSEDTDLNFVRHAKQISSNKNEKEIINCELEKLLENRVIEYANQMKLF